MPNSKDRNDEAEVRKAPLFSALDDEASATLRESMLPVKVSKGNTLFKEGDAGDRLYVVVEGKLKLGTTSTDGQAKCLVNFHSLIQDHALQQRQLLLMPDCSPFQMTK
jgi:signal-transduction protein with cAMP-binding, CBS, and nucleotidyltransferase domain